MIFFSEIQDFDRIRDVLEDLKIDLPRAKFDEEVDFEARLAVAPQKPSQKDEKRKFVSEIYTDFFFFFGVENEMSGIIRNAFWRSFVPIEADLIAYRCRRRDPIL